jgi:hypothetical protein
VAESRDSASALAQRSLKGGDGTQGRVQPQYIEAFSARIDDYPTLPKSVHERLCSLDVRLRDRDFHIAQFVRVVLFPCLK